MVSKLLLSFELCVLGTKILNQLFCTYVNHFALSARLGCFIISFWVQYACFVYLNKKTMCVSEIV